MTKPNAKSGGEFIQLTIDILEKTSELCNETYAATVDGISERDAKKLISRAEEHLTNYAALLESYTGGRRASIEKAGAQMSRLRDFTNSLKNRT